MAKLRQAIEDVLTKLREIDVVNKDSQTVNLFTRVWNNQVAYEKAGQLEFYPKPAAFVEVVTPAAYDVLGEGYRITDIAFKIHVVHEYMNADGTFEQDLVIFDLRDKINETLARYTPAGCGPLMPVIEEQDYEHDNLYQYNITFVAAFVDDSAAKQYAYTGPPTDLELNVETINETNNILYTVNQGKGYSTKYTALQDGESTNLLVLDENGNQIVGANIISVFKEIKMLTADKYSWQPDQSVISLLGGISLSKDESLFIIYQQNIY